MGRGKRERDVRRRRQGTAVVVAAPVAGEDPFGAARSGGRACDPSQTCQRASLEGWAVSSATSGLGAVEGGSVPLHNLICRLTG